MRHRMTTVITSAAVRVLTLPGPELFVSFLFRFYSSRRLIIIYCIIYIFMHV